MCVWGRGGGGHTRLERQSRDHAESYTSVWVKQLMDTLVSVKGFQMEMPCMGVTRQCKNPITVGLQCTYETYTAS